MRPRSQCPASVTARKRLPSGSIRSPEMPPKSVDGEVNTSPPRNSSLPKRRRSWSRLSKEVIGVARTSMRPCASAGAAASRSAAAARSTAGETGREKSATRCPRIRPPASMSGGVEEGRGFARPDVRLVHGRAPRRLGGMLVKQFRKLLGHRAPELLGIDDGHGTAVVAGHVMADADGDELDRRARLD